MRIVKIEKNKKTTKNVLESVRDWYKKISYIEHQINSLEKVKNIPLISISVFLLKTQDIEFRLKQLITGLDLHIYFSCKSSMIKPQGRTPKQLEKENVKMLGQIIGELKKYKSDILKKLIEHLDELNNKRIKFAHKLYDPEGTIEEMHKEAEGGILLANKILLEINKIEKLLSENDPLKSS